jgi:hypothetical protein
VKEITGNILNLQVQGKQIVIPINGYIRKDGTAVMGRGLAYQVQAKYPELPQKLGKILDEIYQHKHILGTPIKNGTNIPVSNIPEYLIFFPVKYNWWESANLALIEQSCKSLLEHIHYNMALQQSDYPIYLPHVGCGYGKLSWHVVEPVLNKYLNNEEKFVICDNGVT